LKKSNQRQKGTNKTIRAEEETQATSIAASDDDHSST